MGVSLTKIQNTNILPCKGLSLEKVREIMTWEVSFGINERSSTVFKIVKFPF
jgi:hypothetical protein